MEWRACLRVATLVQRHHQAEIGVHAECLAARTGPRCLGSTTRAMIFELIGTRVNALHVTLCAFYHAVAVALAGGVGVCWRAAHNRFFLLSRRGALASMAAAMSSAGEERCTRSTPAHAQIESRATRHSGWTVGPRAVTQRGGALEAERSDSLSRDMDMDMDVMLRDCEQCARAVLSHGHVSAYCFPAARRLPRDGVTHRAASRG